MEEFAMYGAGIGVVGYIVVNLMNGQVPGIMGMVPLAVGGAVLGAMVYIFAKGTGTV